MAQVTIIFDPVFETVYQWPKGQLSYEQIVAIMLSHMVRTTTKFNLTYGIMAKKDILLWAKNVLS